MVVSKHPIARRTWASLIAVGVLFAGSTNAWSDTSERHPIDRDDLERVKSSVPHAYELFEQGEQLLGAGNIKQAAEALGQAAAEMPASALLARRECQALTTLGRGEEAIVACRRALHAHGSAMDQRALVAALTSRARPPSPNELTEALSLIRSASNSMPNQPWGNAALCDLAVRLGDTQMLDTCVEGLRRVAPLHYETQYYEGLQKGVRSAWPVLVGWAAIFLAAVATFAHAASRRLRRTIGARALGVAACLVVWAASPNAQATATVAVETDAGTFVPLSTWDVDDADPEGHTPTPEQIENSPLDFGHYLLDLSYKAEKAERRKDYAAAVKYFRALAKVVPDTAISFTKVCKAYEALEDWQNALDYCRLALARTGVSLTDYQNFVRLQLAKKGALVASEVEDVAVIIKSLSASESSRAAAAQMQCDLGVRLGSAKDLEECTATLTALVPKDLKTIVPYQWALAMKRRDLAEASRLVDVAKTTSIKPETLEQMEQTTQMASSIWRRHPRVWAGLSVALLLGAVITVVATRRRSAALA